ncbi:MAG: thioredoxin family protein, partial [Alphaproteobacteria bacterium]|nr:thioredoxin family protein [Alphaproteobacteria bacterium]
MFRILSILFTLLVAGPAFGQAVVTTDNVRAELISEAATVKPGEPFWVALRQTMKPHWHTYWKNPGDAGQATDIKWTLPAGATAEAIVWPVPAVIDVGGVINYGFSDEAMLLDVCIPEEGKFALDLPVGPAAKPATAATLALFDKARRQVPTDSPWPARFGVAKAAGDKTGDPTLIVEAKGLKPETVRDVYFFPAEWGFVAHSPKHAAVVTAEGIRVPLKKGDAKAAVPQTLAGVLVLTEKTADGNQRQAFNVSAKFDPAFVPAPMPLAALATDEQLTLFEALLFALVGGLILNLMPCVFPVLAMKAAAFARLAGTAPGEIRRDGLAYTAGVLASFGAMAAIVLAIRASVGEVSWGFQFQSPVFSLLVAYLFFTVGLNLSGLFEISGRFTGMGQGLVGRGGTTGAFFTGVLAVIVATPCTAPFMAAALGFALSQPGAKTVAVLLAMGLGLALPYLVLSLTPALQRRLPRPGPWMDRLRQLLAFPMYASAIWMVWVLVQQTGADGVLYALGGMVLIGFAIWLLRFGPAETLAGWLRRGTAIASIALALAAVVKIEEGSATAAASPSGGATTGVSFEGWERFSRARMTEAAAAGKPVFVDFTAAWCITCLVNERVALETPATRRAFEQTGTVKLKGDWTNRDPEISA